MTRLPGVKGTRRVTTALIGVGLAAVLIQFVPVQRSNPPIAMEVPAPAPVRSILRRACYDCHSNETVWPWYARVAPVSWLVARDVREGRDAVNISTWNRYGATERTKKLRQAWKAVDKGDMPPWYYKTMHPEARLSAEEMAALRAWASGETPLDRARGGGR
jgi:hypothetical protein